MDALPSCFCVIDAEIRDKKDKTTILEIQKQYKKQKEPKTLKTNAELRKILYQSGFVCNGTKYCRMKRSSGSARVGKCLFINETLLKPILKFSSGNLAPKNGQEIDLAAYESYACRRRRQHLRFSSYRRIILKGGQFYTALLFFWHFTNICK